MANGHGGYRRPTNPATVSGPGAHSQRTDGQPIRDLPNADYGENAVFTSLQQGAPLASGGTAPAGGGAAAVDPLAALTGLDAGTSMPDQPVTAGAALGDGPGMDALGIPQDDGAERAQDAEFLRKYIPAMVVAASSDSSSPAFRAYLRRVLAQLR